MMWVCRFGRFGSTITVLCASLAVTSCSETVVLRDDDTGFSLTYSCEDIRPIARSTSEKGLVRSYAMRIVQTASDAFQMEEEVRQIISADTQGNFSTLERRVVQFMCDAHVVLASMELIEAARRANSSGPVEDYPGRDIPLPVLSASELWGDSESITLRDLEGNWTVLTFFATWCLPCRQEFPDLVRLHREYSARGLTVVGVVHEDSPEQVRRWIEEQGSSYPMVVDESDDLARAFRVRGIPQTHLLDPNGRVAKRIVGYTGPEWLVPLEAAMNQILEP